MVWGDESEVGAERAEAEWAGPAEWLSVAEMSAIRARETAWLRCAVWTEIVWWVGADVGVVAVEVVMVARSVAGVWV